LTATIKAIQTRYKDCHFRSRTEARWAVFYDALEIEWFYEFDGFVLPGDVQYLPDFWLPKQDCYIEIKGARPTWDEEHRCYQLAQGTGKNVYCFFGDIKNPEDQDYETNDGAHAYLASAVAGTETIEVACDNFYHWCECSQCGFLGIEYSGRSERLCCPCNKTDREFNCDTPRLRRAYEIARSARFEFGEIG
jgi:hypothetical protein